MRLFASAILLADFFNLPMFVLHADYQLEESAIVRVIHSGTIIIQGRLPIKNCVCSYAYCGDLTGDMIPEGETTSSLVP